MITAIVNIDLYRYEIHSLLKAFYPQEDVKVLTQADAENNRKYQKIAKEPFLKVTFDDTIVTLSFCDGSGTRSAKAPEGTSFACKGTLLKTQMKHLLYAMLADREERTLPWGELIGIRPTKIAMQSLLRGETPEQAAADLERDHLVSPGKALLSAQIAQREREILADIHYENGYSLYVGIPFCPTTCLYCSFPSFNLAHWKDRVDDYLDALEKEIATASEMMRGRVLDTVYIGGGTPTTLEPAQLERLFSLLEKYFPMEDIQEFTIEAGRPDSITADKLRVIRAHKVTRISVNPQTMKEETLRLIGRRHTVQQVRDAFALCREAGFDNINMDIILGLPEETEEDVARTLEEIEKRMGMEPYYLYRQKNISGNLENVGYSRPGKAGIYNILIMEEKQSILALGAGSISKAVFPGGRIERSDNCKDVETYLENIDEMIERKRRLGIGNS